MHRASLAHMKSLLPTDPSDQFYLGLFVVHGLAAVASGIMSMYCEVSFASQQAMRVAPIHGNASHLMRTSEIQLFMGATPWSEDDKFESHRWNPYILVLAFQWLTAWFAFCNIRHWHDPKDIKGWAIAGVFLGIVVIAVWAVLPNPRSQEPCLAMYILLLLSFIAAPLIFSRYFWILEQEELALLLHSPPPGNEEEQPRKGSEHPPQQWESFQTPDDPMDPAGDNNNSGAAPRRMWNIPKRIAMLKKGTATTAREERQRLLLLGMPVHSLKGELTPEQTAAKKEILFRRAIDAVGFRYAEYCITAPLLFLAVMCLLVTDAPAWLFLAGYWLVQACNAVGIALHYNITGDVGERVASKGAIDKWFEDIMSEGLWCDCTFMPHPPYTHTHTLLLSLFHFVFCGSAGGTATSNTRGCCACHGCA